MQTADSHLRVNDIDDWSSSLVTKHTQIGEMLQHSQAGFKLAPPTKNPSISSCVANSLQFFSLTLPPYKILVCSAASFETDVDSQERIAACTSCAWDVVATLPVPMAHMGSYAMTILDQSLTLEATAES